MDSIHGKNDKKSCDTVSLRECCEILNDLFRINLQLYGVLDPDPDHFSNTYLEKKLNTATLQNYR